MSAAAAYGFSQELRVTGAPPGRLQSGAAVPARIRAPRAHGAAVVEPPFPDWPRLLAENAAQLPTWDVDLLGCSLSRLRKAARRELFEQATQYTSVYRDVSGPARRGPDRLILAGHQPHLFHAGVWFKNFALSASARQLQATAINLLVDNDILQSAGIRVPVSAAAGPQVETFAFDAAGEAVPYEERLVRDPACFASFGSRVTAAVADWNPQPLLAAYWPLVLEAYRRTPNLGRCLAEGRHRLEGQWQQETLEVPLSIVCDGTAFLRFVVYLLAHLPRLQEIYNTALAEYRRVNGLRSRSHPVPDLAMEGTWREAPFWLWTTDAPRRRRLFARSHGDVLELTDREGLCLSLPLAPDADGERAVAQLRDPTGRGIKLRPRALLTTMYARLFLTDLFLHGIGGAKYDQLTDRIIERFFGRPAPHFATLSATALLFPDRTGELRDELRHTRQLVRELRYRPERHVPRTPETERLLADKRRWVELQLPRGQRGERHHGIARVNRALQPLLAARGAELAQRAADLTTELRRQTTLSSREFAFCLSSEDRLRSLLLDLSRQLP